MSVSAGVRISIEPQCGTYEHHTRVRPVWKQEVQLKVVSEPET